MQEVHRILFDKLNADAMIYFADHGEELKIKFCHGNEFFRNNYKKYDSVKEIRKAIFQIIWIFVCHYAVFNACSLDVLRENFCSGGHYFVGYEQALAL